MDIRHFLAVVLTGAMGVGLLSGCAPKPQDKAAPGDEAKQAGEGNKEYNPHDAPITDQQKDQLRQETAQFPQAVAKIKQFRDQTEQETKNGIPENPYQVHQALDKVDLVLQWLPEIARNSGVPKDRWEEINTSANDLRTLFEKVHQNIDNQKNPDFAAVAPEIDQKIAGLQQIAGTGENK